MQNKQEFGALPFRSTASLSLKLRTARSIHLLSLRGDSTLFHRKALDQVTAEISLCLFLGSATEATQFNCSFKTRTRISSNQSIFKTCSNMNSLRFTEALQNQEGFWRRFFLPILKSNPKSYIKDMPHFVKEYFTYLSQKFSARNQHLRKKLCAVFKTPDAQLLRKHRYCLLLLKDLRETRTG